MDVLATSVTVFYSFAEKDASLLEQLEHHLSVLQRHGLIAPWQKRQITAGQDWQAELDTHLNTASLIFLLISPDFLASDYCYGIEMMRALQRRDAGEAQVIPILLRPVDWQLAPFAHLRVLPGNEKPVTLWPNQDEAWLDVAQGIRKVVEELLQKGQAPGGRKRSSRPAAFPPLWNVPYRYSFFFTGREQVVEQLFQTFTLSSPGGTPLQALSGLGGMGKTQTAVEYAYRYRQEYQAVLWINAESEETLLVGFQRAAELLRRPVTHLQDRQSLTASFQEWFRNTTEWLLILDNADDLARVEPFLPKVASGHLLLTTRATALETLAQPLALMPLSQDDGALCLLRRAAYLPAQGQLSDATPGSVKAARELSQAMGGLPLALEQAGAYIEATGRGVRGYLDLYLQYRAELRIRDPNVVPSYRVPVAFAWNQARERVRQESLAALELLQACAFLAPQSIPYDLFVCSASRFGSTLEALAARPLDFDQAVALLRKHSLIKNEVDKDTDLPSLIMHPVLQEVLRDSLDPRTRRIWAERAVQAVTLAASLSNNSILQAHLRHATRLLEEA